MRTLDMQLRPYTPADEDAYVALRMGVEHSFDEAHVRAIARGELVPVPRFEVAEVDGAVAGAALVLAPPFLPPALRMTQLIVAPEHRRSGIGSALLDDVIGSLNTGITMMGVVRDDDPASLTTVEHWGFTAKMHGIASALPLTGKETYPTAPDGVTVSVSTRWDNLPSDMDSAYLDSDTSPENDVLGTTEITSWRSMFRRPLIVYALSDGHVAAMAVANRQANGDLLVVYTGVPKAYRRRGLARLVKEHLHAAAANRGFDRVTTQNEERNTSIRALNDALGYQHEVGEIRVQRTIT
jgi:GNAT superfamily N-acetyltransferase